jgi:ferredoxin--NADP+ reductase
MKHRRYCVHFLRSPIEIVGEERVTSVTVEQNRLEGEPFQLRAVGTGVKESLECGLVFRSVGYRGVPMPGVPFDAARGIIPNREGRVMNGSRSLPGLYVVGWIKRGPTGVIGTNKPDSQETVAGLLADLPRLQECPERNSGKLAEILRDRGVQPVSFADWLKIDAAEIERGRRRGKPREKFVRIEDCLALLN